MAITNSILNNKPDYHGTLQINTIILQSFGHLWNVKLIFEMFKIGFDHICEWFFIVISINSFVVHFYWDLKRHPWLIESLIKTTIAFENKWSVAH